MQPQTTFQAVLSLISFFSFYSFLFFSFCQPATYYDSIMPLFTQYIAEFSSYIQGIYRVSYQPENDLIRGIYIVALPPRQTRVKLTQTLSLSLLHSLSLFTRYSTSPSLSLSLYFFVYFLAFLLPFFVALMAPNCALIVGAAHNALRSNYQKASNQSSLVKGQIMPATSSKSL